MVKGSDLEIDKDKCVGCGMCVNTYPELFKLEGAHSSVIQDGEVDADLDQILMSCPEEAIKQKES